jgi:hypothetical protein
MGTNMPQGPATSTDGYMGDTSKEPATCTIHGSIPHSTSNYCHNFNIDSNNGCVLLGQRQWQRAFDPDTLYD